MDAPQENDVEEITHLFKGLKKKKPKSKAAGNTASEAIPKQEHTESIQDNAADFEARLADAGAGMQGQELETASAKKPETDTAVWGHNSTDAISYAHLLNRFFTILEDQNPDIQSSGSKSFKIPPPQCLREGSKKTIFANLTEICTRMKRNDEQVIQFMFAELGTTGSVDGSRRLVIKGRFQQKQIENVLRRYIGEYVTCKTCRASDTELNKGENRLSFITCNVCGSRRSVSAIKVGFTAQIGKRRRMQG